MRRPSFAALLPLLVAAAVAAVAAADADEPPRFRGSGRKDKLLVILLDGFRWDYAERDGLKAFAKIKEIGVTAEYLKPVFPAMSFPNYYSLATGLYVESHGMVMNYMYDSDREQSFLMLNHKNSTQPFWWEEAEPIWITATKKGKKSFLYLWPGGEVTIHGVKPASAEPYQLHLNGHNMFRQHLDDALQRFKHNEADLVQIYCEHSDYVGHTYGPESPEMKDALRELDYELNAMFDKIKKVELENKVNVIIVSDHGMTSTSKDSVKRFSLDKFLQVNEVQLIMGQGAIVGVFPKRGYKEKVYDDLKKSQDVHVWKREDLPEDYHMKHNKRTPPIVVLAKKGVFITPVREHRVQVPFTSSLETRDYNGFHGYDVEEVEDMKGIFYGFGPGFEVNERHPGIGIVDVYNIMMHFLDLEPLPNNGSWTSVYRMVKSENGATALWAHGLSTALSCVGALFIYALTALFNSLWI